MPKISTDFAITEGRAISLMLYNIQQVATNIPIIKVIRVIPPTFSHPDPYVLEQTLYLKKTVMGQKGEN